MPLTAKSPLSTPILLYSPAISSPDIPCRAFVGEKFYVSRQWAVCDSWPSVIISQSEISVSESSYCFRVQSESKENALNL